MDWGEVSPLADCKPEWHEMNALHLTVALSGEPEPGRENGIAQHSEGTLFLKSGMKQNARSISMPRTTKRAEALFHNISFLIFAIQNTLVLLYTLSLKQYNEQQTSSQLTQKPRSHFGQLYEGNRPQIPSALQL